MDRIKVTTGEMHGVPVVRLDGQVDKLAVDQARSQLEPLAAAGKLVLDLDGVSFIDSAGLHALFVLGRLAATQGGGLALSVTPASPVARAIAIVRLADAIPVRECVEDAAAALSETPDQVSSRRSEG